MEREELKSRVDDVLGSTQLQLSERTINEELDDALSDVTNDDEVTDAFVTRIANRLKRMNGNLHADVGAESRKYREQFEADWKKKHPEGSNAEEEGNGDDKFKVLNDKLEKALKQLEDADEERKQEKAKARKETVTKQIKEGLDDLFKKANVDVNAYILKQSMRDVEIPDDADVDKLVKQVEKIYYKNLKEAGIDGIQPRGGSFGPPASKKVSDDLWEKKKRKEGWGDKK